MASGSKQPPLYQRAMQTYSERGLAALATGAANYALRRGVRLPGIDHFCYRLSKWKLQRRMQHEDDLDDVLDTAFEFSGYGRYQSIEPIQVREELATLAKLVAEHDPSVVMEIGTAAGGTFYTWCRWLDSAELLISLDLPDGEFGGGYSQRKLSLFRAFAPEKELSFVRADSHDPSTVETIRDILDGRNVDFLLIDGDHRYDGVKKDFKTYRRFVADDGFIAFHDIVPGPPENVGGVPEFWRKIEQQHPTDVIVNDWNQGGYGIGLVHP